MYRKGDGRVYYFSKWIADKGDSNLLFDYSINDKSLVVDIGGYKGFFSDKIISLYNPTIFIVEPVKEYFLILKNKYKNNKKVGVFNYGLSDKNGTQNIYLSDDGTSLIKKTGQSEKIKLVDAAIFLRKFKSIDLLSVNIEGAEYQVLERLIKTDLIKRVQFLQVQFHEFAPHAKNLRKRIIKKILKTHRVRFSYPFVWESFELKK